MKSKVLSNVVIFLAIITITSYCTKSASDPERIPDFNTEFTVDPNPGFVNTTITFDASKSYCERVDDEDFFYDLSVRWDFDYTGPEDLFWDTERTIVDIATHIYTEAKTYRVLLGTFDLMNNLNDTTSKLVVITESTGTPPIAAFVAIPTNGTAPLTVYFTDQSTNDPTSWQWEFGNGESSEEQNPTYTYNDVGTYTVKLTTTNDHGSDDEEKLNYIIVNDGSNACPGAPTATDVDGNEYPTVLIGDQCWMKENLKTTKYNDGTPIPNVGDANAWANLTTGAYVWYENAISWKDKYGAMYNWYAVDDPNGLCPTGWHVPSEDEWIILTGFINGYSQGYKLRSCRQVNSPLGGECNTTEHPRWDESVSHGTDQFGLSLIPGGSRELPGYFISMGSRGCLWASTYDLDVAWFANMSSTSLFLNADNPKRGYSLRCLKDD